MFGGVRIRALDFESAGVDGIFLAVALVNIFFSFGVGFGDHELYNNQTGK